MRHQGGHAHVHCEHYTMQTTFVYQPVLQLESFIAAVPREPGKVHADVMVKSCTVWQGTWTATS